MTWGLLRYTLITATIGEVDKRQSEGGLLYDLGNGQRDIPEVRKLINEVLLRDSLREGFWCNMISPMSQATCNAEAPPFAVRRSGSTAKVLLVMVDVTGSNTLQK